MNTLVVNHCMPSVSAGCHINDVMNRDLKSIRNLSVSAGCHINDVMNFCSLRLANS